MDRRRARLIDLLVVRVWDLSCHIALANDGLDGPGKPGRQASVFAKENGWEKTDVKIGYRVPLHAKATPMFVYRKKVPVGQLTLPRVNWSGPVILLPAAARVNAAKTRLIHTTRFTTSS